MEKYLIYLRKSQKDNPDEKVEEVLRKHEIRLQEYALNAFGYNIPEEDVYREVVSGETIEARTEIKKVLSLIESDKVKGAIVIEPQRLGRGDLQDCGALVNAFRYSHTLIVTPPKTYNLSDKYDRKFFEMELQRGSDYLEYYKEIQARGRVASVKRGNYIGSVPPYGYSKVWVKDEDGRKCCTLEIVPKEAEAVKIMFDLYTNKKYGFQRIAYTLGDMGYLSRHNKLWSPQAIKDILANPIYIGKVRWNRRKNVKVLQDGNLVITRPRNTDTDDIIIADGKHHPIIDNDLFERTQAIRDNNPGVQSYVELRNYFSGILFCGKCGRSMILRPYYKRGSGGTKERAASRIVCPDQKVCGNGSALYSILHEQVIKSLEQHLEELKVSVSGGGEDIVDNRAAVNTLRKNIENLENKEVSLWEKYTDEQRPKKIFDELIKKKELAIESARKVLALAESESERIYPVEYKISSVQAALDALQDNNVQPKLKNQLLKTCIKRITYSRPRPKRNSNPDVCEWAGWSDSPITLNIELNF